MHRLVDELRTYGTVDFTNEANALWIVRHYTFEITFVDAGTNVIGCKLRSMKVGDDNLPLFGTYIIKSPCIALLKCAFESLSDSPSQLEFAESFLEFRLPDDSTELLKHYRYMGFLESRLGNIHEYIRKWHDEMCKYGFNPTYTDDVMTVDDTLDNNKFVFKLLLSESIITVEYRSHIYKCSITNWYQSPIAIIKKFISMVDNMMKI